MSGNQRLRGLRALITDAVEHGASAVERVHRATAERPFAVLEAIPPLAAPARLVHRIHDVSLTATYGAIRLVNRVAGGVLETVLEEGDQQETMATGPGAQDEPPR